MCGIAAVVNKRKEPVPEGLIRKMTDLVSHRGPDDEGAYFDANVSLGHRRLSIIDLSPLGHQPMLFDDYAIVFNGEIYNYLEVRAELISLGYHFKSQSDTEVILAAYDYWGLEALNRFNGMWAIILYDKKRRILIGSRDRFGVKPLCYTETNGVFMMASEAKQFTAAAEFAPSLNLSTSSHFLDHVLLNYNEETFFNEVKTVPGGHNLIFHLNDNNFEIEQWYNLNRINQKEHITDSAAAESFRELLYDSIKLRLRSDVRVGSCLSGGLDSSSIAVLVHKQLPEDHPFYTISSCYPGTPYDEQLYIDAVVGQTGFNGIKIFPDLHEIQSKGLLEKMLWHQDQPLPSMSHFSEYKVFEAAKLNRLIVMLDGQGSDEYLAGYGEFFTHYQYQLFQKGHYLTWVSEVAQRAKLRDQSLRWVFAGAVRFNKANKKRLSQYGEGGVMVEAKAGGVHPVGNVFSLSKQQILKSSIPYQLHSADRNSMMHSIESRVPFLDYRLVEFGLSLPDNLKIRKGITKYVLREALKKDLPAAIYSRHTKLGFPAPENEWMITQQQWFSGQLKTASGEFPAVFGKDLSEKFNQTIRENKVLLLPYYFRALSLFKWIKVFSVKVNS